jgi:hypothetical protein
VSCRAAVARGTSAACRPDVLAGFGSLSISILLRRRPFSLHKLNATVGLKSGTMDGMTEPWLRRDYSGLWCLPPSLPPTRWPRVLLALVLAVSVAALAAGW